jgi:hypothetical protein
VLESAHKPGKFLVCSDVMGNISVSVHLVVDPPALLLAEVASACTYQVERKSTEYESRSTEKNESATRANLLVVESRYAVELHSEYCECMHVCMEVAVSLPTHHTLSIPAGTRRVTELFSLSSAICRTRAGP